MLILPLERRNNKALTPENSPWTTANLAMINTKKPGNFSPASNQHGD